MPSTRHIAILKTSINLASGIDATKLAHVNGLCWLMAYVGLAYVNGHICTWALYILTISVLSDLSLLVQESQENIYHFYHLSKSEFCSKIKIT